MPNYGHSSWHPQWYISAFPSAVRSPSDAFPKGCNISPNHWANGQTNIILPYVSTTSKNLGLGEEYMAVVIFDTFKGHKGDEMDSRLLENNIHSVIVPSNCTDLLQPGSFS